MTLRRSRAGLPLLAPSVVVIGSYREDLAGLLAFAASLAKLGLDVLHPPPEARSVGEDLGFVRLDCDRSQDKERVQRYVFSLIDKADAVIFYSPSGRIGISAALEIGYALRANKRILATAPPHDPIIHALIDYDPSALLQFLRSATGAGDSGEHERAIFD